MKTNACMTKGRLPDQILELDSTGTLCRLPFVKSQKQTKHGDQTT